MGLYFDYLLKKNNLGLSKELTFSEFLKKGYFAYTMVDFLEKYKDLGLEALDISFTKSNKKKEQSGYFYYVFFNKYRRFIFWNSLFFVTRISGFTDLYYQVDDIEVFIYLFREQLIDMDIYEPEIVEQHLFPSIRANHYVINMCKNTWYFRTNIPISKTIFNEKKKEPGSMLNFLHVTGMREHVIRYYELIKLRNLKKFMQLYKTLNTVDNPQIQKIADLMNKKEKRKLFSNFLMKKKIEEKINEQMANELKEKGYILKETERYFIYYYSNKVIKMVLKSFPNEIKKAQEKNNKGS
jgi:hypothetical protein